MNSCRFRFHAEFLGHYVDYFIEIRPVSAGGGRGIPALEVESPFQNSDYPPPPLTLPPSGYS
jgi:hypothetical protein